MTSCFISVVYKVINFSFQFRCLRFSKIFPGLQWRRPTMAASAVDTSNFDIRDHWTSFDWVEIVSNILSMNWSDQIGIYQFPSLFFARLQLMVAETFGEEENSILETARLEKSWQKKKSSNTAIVLNFLVELNIAHCMPSKNVLKF